MKNSLYTYEYSNVPIGYLQVAGLPFHDVNLSGLQTQILAKLNPSRGQISPVNMFVELRDLPRTIRDVGYALGLGGGRRASNPGGTHLAIEFGVKPLLNDLTSLFQFAETLERRRRFLHKASSDGSVGGSLHVDGTTWPLISPSASVQGFGSVKGYYTARSSHTAWFTGRYTANLSGMPEPGSMLSKLMGMNLSMPIDILWNAIPWTWLIDYFSNWGDFITACGGSIPFEVTGTCIMCTSTTQITFRGTNYPQVPIAYSGDLRVVKKQRGVFPNVKNKLRFEPVLTHSQWGILAALLAARSRY